MPSYSTCSDEFESLRRFGLILFESHCWSQGCGVPDFEPLLSLVAQLLLGLSQAGMFDAEKDSSFTAPMFSLELEKIPLLDTGWL